MAPLTFPRTRGWWARLLTATVMLAFAMSSVAWADDDTNSEVAQQRIEAAYLYKFGAYVTWPDKAFATPDSPIVIGVAGTERLASELEALVAGRSIGTRPVVVRRMHADTPLNGLHILFITDKELQSSGLIQAAHNQPILLVTEGAAGLGQGAAVSFVVVDDRVRFDVSLDTVQESGLKLSAALLSVAHLVDGAKP
jgi:YfiR/HmsC-like